jgi:flagellar motor switch protein FliM
MTKGSEPPNADAGAGKLKEALRDRAGFSVERMPGLAHALNQFVAEAERNLAPLLAGRSGAGTIEAAQGTTLFEAIGDCSGLTAAIYASAEPEARLLIALDERIDDLVVASVFGESSVLGEGDEAPVGESPSRTAIETALVEEFARALGRAIETAFAPLAPISIAFDRLMTLSDAYALGRRVTPGAAARFSLPLGGGACECLILLPQSILLPLRKALEREAAAEPPRADRRWSLSMEKEVKQTRLPVTAILEELPMRLGDVANFRVGGVLPLRCNGFDSVRLECAGRGVFLCKLGQGDGRYRLEIDVPIAQEPGPAVH